MAKTSKSPKTSSTARKAVGGSAGTNNQAQKASAPEAPAETPEEMDGMPAAATPSDTPVPEKVASDTPAAVIETDGDPVPALHPVPPAMPALGITEQLVIVIAAPGEAAQLLIRAWAKAAAPADIRLISPAETLAETFESLVADDQLPDEFIFVPGICFPVGKMTLADLTLYRTRILEKGESRNNTGLPMLLTKEIIPEVLKAFEAEPEQSDEILMRTYNGIAHKGEIPNTASLHFGNTVIYGTKADLCTGRLVDALLLKKFICLNLEAFGTAERYLNEYVKR